MAKYDYVLWDWNGTIVDDLDINLKIINQLLKERNLPTITLQRYKEIFTFPIIEFYRSAGFDCQEYTYNLLVSDYKSAYTAQMHNIHLMPYAKTILSEIKKKNVSEVIEIYENLQIHQRKDIAINADTICQILNKKKGPFLNDIYRGLEEKIISDELLNEQKNLINYIINSIQG